MNKNKKKLTSVDLFCGIGGIALGFRAAGIKTVTAIDYYVSNAEYFPKNFPEVPFIYQDICNIDPHTIDIKGEELTVIAGGPPCQGFSLIGLKDHKDPRRDLVFEFRRFVRELKPKYFVMENVPGILTKSNSKYLESLMKMLEKDGYNLNEPIILNACEFGAPTDRKRVFFLGTRKDLNYRLKPPQPTHISLRNIQSTCPEIASGR